jgi:putative colanic acid biosynthesis acetyltransferase WcaF
MPWQVAWQVCQSLAFKPWWVPATFRASLLRAFGAHIGTGVLIRNDVTVHWPWKLSVGDHSWVGVGAWILNLEPVTIGSNTCISQSAFLCTGNHDRHSPTFEFDNGPIVIGDGVWVAARATVLRGVTVGDGAVIGACALVARDVAPAAMVASPAPTTAPAT